MWDPIIYEKVLKGHTFIKVKLQIIQNKYLTNLNILKPLIQTMLYLDNIIFFIKPYF